MSSTYTQGIPRGGASLDDAVFYAVSDQMAARLENDFTYHSPKPSQVPRYNALREKAKELAYLIVRLSPPGREQSAALTSLETATMQANAAIAREP